jgi:hypothetical protein
MSIVGTFNSTNIIGLPCDTIAGVLHPSSIEWNAQEVVSANASSFTGQVQTYDFMASWWEATVTLPPLQRASADAWQSFLMECRGQSNFFQLGDPKRTTPKGAATGTPKVNGASQTGYNLLTKGWTASVSNILLQGDFIQIGYRLYSIMDAVNSDATGLATLHIWPNLRDLPADGTTITTTNCKGLFRLASNTNKWSTNAGNYGVTAFQIREAI